MEILIIALILGIIEGLTEFLPVSSTGHLIMATEILKLDQERMASFNIIIQMGAILAVVFLYKERFKNLLTIHKNFSHQKLNFIHIGIGVLPVLLVGFVTRKLIKAYLYTPYVVIFTLIIVGLLMIWIERIKPNPNIHSVDQISYLDALIIGLSQCFALIPGVSRSGATMLASMMRRIDVTTSADFSFLISVPVISIATIYELLKSYSGFTVNDTIQLALGFTVSFFVAILAVKTFLYVLKKLSLKPFAYYRIAIGLAYYFYLKML